MEEKEQYRVVKSRSRVYKSTIALKGLYIFNALLLSFSLILAVFPTLLLLFRLLDKASGSALQFIAFLGLTFFYPLTLFILLALLLNLGLIALLSLGVRKDWPLLTGSISLMTAFGHALVLASMILCMFIFSAQDQFRDHFAGAVTTIRSVVEVYPAAVFIAAFLLILIATYYLAFLVNGMRGYRETMTVTPLSTLFPSGILVESARDSDVESMVEIEYSLRHASQPGKKRHEFWNSLMTHVSLERDVRVARLDEDVVGFLITSRNFGKVESVHLSEALSSDQSDEIERCLLHDFARLNSRSDQYVDFIEVSSNDLKLQKALSHNGWESTKGSSSRKVGFRYIGEQSTEVV